MEKAFTDIPSEKHSDYSLQNELAILESVRQSRKQRRCRWLSYLLVALCTAFVVIGSVKAYDCLVRTGSRSVDISILSDDVSARKGKKEEGFALWGYHGDGSCGGKNRTIINKGSHFVPACLTTTVNYDSMQLFNGQKPGYFGVCLYDADTCAEGSAITKAPVKGCMPFNSTKVKGYRLAYGVRAGFCY